MSFDGYDIWINNRFNVIINTINNVFGADYLKGKTLLELGAGMGDFGYKFYEKGMNVTCLEGRNLSLDILQSRYPYFESRLCDLDKDE